MQLGTLLPLGDIGGDPAVVREYAQTAESIEEALAAVGELGFDPPPRILITGSLYLAGEVLAANGTELL